MYIEYLHLFQLVICRNNIQISRDQSKYTFLNLTQCISGHI